MPGIGSHGSAFTAHDEASSFDLRQLFMACGLHGASEPKQETRLVARVRRG
jgi:hypothetical protein